MAKKGGYQIVDLKGVSLTASTASVIPGVGEQLQGANGKRTVVSGLVVSGDAQPDTEVLFTNNSGTYTGKFGIWTLSIVAATNSVTVTETQA